MKSSTIMNCLSGGMLCFFAIGCSVSASVNFNTEGRAVLHGKDAILVKAAQPDPPPPPPKPVKISKAKVVEEKIEISEKVMFDTDKATIKLDSNDLLTDVATVIKEHQEIKKLRIEGHTDADGSDKYNKKLSQQRADAVRDFLVKAGIAEDRLIAVGYGEERPVATNDNAEGKEKNRRVEFNILDKEKKENE